MLLYLAGELGPERLERLANKAGTNNFLFTFAHAGARSCARYFCVQPQRRIFIDSGSFTAWTKEIKLDDKYLGEYMEFCKEIQRLAKCPVTFAALDIPLGKKGDKLEKLTPAVIEQSCEKGWYNYQTMKQEGIPCLPTFHQLENIRWLRRIADDCDYFAVSPRKDTRPEDRHSWLKGVFRYIGIAKRIHGLGVTSVDWMEQFPFFSVDNTAWLWGGKSQSYRHFANDRAKYLPFEKWKDVQVGMVPKVLAKAFFDNPNQLTCKAMEKETVYKSLSSLKGVVPGGYVVMSELPLNWSGEGTFIDRYRPPGTKLDPDAKNGTYWFVVQAMIQDLAVEEHVTDHWRARGVVWDDKSEGERRLLRRAVWRSQYIDERAAASHPTIIG